MLDFPNAKINIGLNVVNKRNDGYHDIESIFYPVKKYYDALEILVSKEFKFVQYGNKVQGKTEDNLVVKAFKIIQEKFDISNVEIILYKNIPMGAGLGGGSSDAAFTIKMLNQLFELKLTDNQLIELSKPIGSDCPFFIKNKTVFASGTGNIFEEISMFAGRSFLTIISPAINISTKEAYQSLTPTKSELSLKESINEAPWNWKKLIKNDFEKYLLKKHPEIKDIKDELYKKGAEYVSLTGSGSSVYAISSKKIDTKNNFKNCKIWQDYF
ncbi:MAG: 4-(cytidine 5'-diphospho)-2-C-methyl-D-erythritol kinase [Bacteroidota bacterium]|nr:4-(cytidine 5'-diphospho)-2-C-methyl-D-erythritol kinase [Bacteroidota bacterium]